MNIYSVYILFFVPFLRFLYDYTHNTYVDYTNHTKNFVLIFFLVYELHVCDGMLFVFLSIGLLSCL